MTGEKFEHGYEALAELDSEELLGNANGRIDPGDSMFPLLGVWVDSNHDGRAQQEELSTLTELGIAYLSIHYIDTPWQDRHGNEFRYLSFGRIDDGSRPRYLATTDVFLWTGDRVDLRPVNRPPGWP